MTALARWRAWGHPVYLSSRKSYYTERASGTQSEERCKWRHAEKPPKRQSQGGLDVFLTTMLQRCVIVRVRRRCLPRPHTYTPSVRLPRPPCLLVCLIPFKAQLERNLFFSVFSLNIAESRSVFFFFFCCCCFVSLQLSLLCFIPAFLKAAARLIV